MQPRKIQPRRHEQTQPRRHEGTKKILQFLTLLAGAVSLSAVGQHSATNAAELVKDPAVKAALEAAKANEAQTIADQIRFCEVPAPSFKETARGEVLKRTFEQLGLQNVRVDKAGNVLGDYPGAAPRPRLVLAAHLDTVFPEGTDVKVKREGPGNNILRGPGIGDDCRGLAVLVAIVREMKKARVQTPGSITFVAQPRSEEHTSELQSQSNLVCRLLLEKKKNKAKIDHINQHKII